MNESGEELEAQLNLCLSEPVNALRCLWSKSEDLELMIIMEERSNSNKEWKERAEILHSNLALSKKTGKQCRERWQNVLNPEIEKKEWGRKEELEFFKLHEEHGGKWSVISKALGGRTGNMAKNFFYCRLRKVTRMVAKGMLTWNKEGCGDHIHIIYLLEYLRDNFIEGNSHRKLVLSKGKGDKYIMDVIRKNKISSKNIEHWIILLNSEGEKSKSTQSTTQTQTLTQTQTQESTFSPILHDVIPPNIIVPKLIRRDPRCHCHLRSLPLPSASSSQLIRTANYISAQLIHAHHQPHNLPRTNLYNTLDLFQIITSPHYLQFN